MGTSFSASTNDEFRCAADLLVDFNTEYGDPSPEPKWLAGHLSELVDNGDTSVLLTGEPAIGLAILRFRTATWAAEKEAYLAEFYVAPDHRGHGIGRQFLTEVLEHARERGATYVDLNTSEDDEAARHLYEDFGFNCHEGRADGPLAIYYELDL
ncbi:acetyltransferase, putative [Janibacter sp. HTCC2649]|uniref:GNAT family N-acetyltransferase n=1 Tax=Janibacter sp. HTCC2649 TaxID=313589 RepID=UPI000066E9F9|nr:GNAT family N-acetyltransferase [Janibacter sp. HTCC2649]EAP99058.1 acetyltransferase, putative [Janibacter sp. HTCC2649]